MKTTATLLLALANPATAAVYNMKWYASADCTGATLTTGAPENNIYTDICYVTSTSTQYPKSAKLMDPSGVIGTVTYPSVDCTGTAGACPWLILSAEKDCVTSVTAGTCKVVDQNGAKSVMVTATTKPTTIGAVSPAYYSKVSGAQSRDRGAVVTDYAHLRSLLSLLTGSSLSIDYFPSSTTPPTALVPPRRRCRSRRTPATAPTAATAPQACTPSSSRTLRTRRISGR